MTKRAKRNAKLTSQYVYRPSIDNRDAALIRHCVTIDAEFAAFIACFAADPDGNDTNAGRIAQRYRDKPIKHIKAATSIKAATVHGITTKAVTALAILKDDACSLEDHSEAFLLSLIEDALRQGKVAAAEEWERKGGPHESRTDAAIEAMEKTTSVRGLDSWSQAAGSQPGGFPLTWSHQKR